MLPWGTSVRRRRLVRSGWCFDRVERLFAGSDAILSEEGCVHIEIPTKVQIFVKAFNRQLTCVIQVSYL